MPWGLHAYIEMNKIITCLKLTFLAIPYQKFGVPDIYIFFIFLFTCLGQKARFICKDKEGDCDSAGGA